MKEKSRVLLWILLGALAAGLLAFGIILFCAGQTAPTKRICKNIWRNLILKPQQTSFLSFLRRIKVRRRIFAAIEFSYGTKYKIGICLRAISAV